MGNLGQDNELLKVIRVLLVHVEECRRPPRSETVSCTSEMPYEDVVEHIRSGHGDASQFLGYLRRLKEDMLRNLVYAARSGRGVRDGMSMTARLALRQLGPDTLIRELLEKLSSSLAEDLGNYVAHVQTMDPPEPEVVSDGATHVLVRTRWKSDYVDELKRNLPSGAGRWAPEHDAWRIHVDYMPAVEDLLARHFPPAERRDQEACQ